MMKEVQFMNWMKRMFHLCMAALLLMMLCMFSSAMAAEKADIPPEQKLDSLIKKAEDGGIPIDTA